MSARLFSSAVSATVAVITPTCGDPLLRRCLASVRGQQHKQLHHYVVVDGRSHADRVFKVLGGRDDAKVSIVVLPRSTGAGNYFGHRIYGSFPFLLNEDYIAYLDEDNEFSPSHVSSLLALIAAKGLEWAYSLRNIVADDGSFICRDDCDSLGIWGSWYGMQHHIDTSCYLLKRELAIEVAPLWNRRGYSRDCVDPDKAVCRWLLEHRIRGFTSGRYTVRYRLGRNADGAKADYFVYGNRAMRALYKYLPWRRPLLADVDAGMSYRRILFRHEGPCCRKYRLDG